MAISSVTLLNRRTTSGTDGYQEWRHPGGDAVLTFSGPFDGATVTLYTEGADGSDVPVLNTKGGAAKYLSAGTRLMTIATGENVKAVVTNAGAQTAIYCTITGT